MALLSWGKCTYVHAHVHAQFCIELQKFFKLLVKIPLLPGYLKRIFTTSKTQFGRKSGQKPRVPPFLCVQVAFSLIIASAVFSVTSPCREDAFLSEDAFCENILY